MLTAGFPICFHGNRIGVVVALLPAALSHQIEQQNIGIGVVDLSSENIGMANVQSFGLLVLGGMVETLSSLLRPDDELDPADLVFLEALQASEDPVQSSRDQFGAVRLRKRK